MRDARKLFRLFKTVNEAKKIKDLWRQERTSDNVLNLLVRGFFGLYWIFDNLNILSKIKILNYDNKQMAKIGATFWLLALLTNLLLLLKNLKDLLPRTASSKRTSSLTQSLLLSFFGGGAQVAEEGVPRADGQTPRGLHQDPESAGRHHSGWPGLAGLPQLSRSDGVGQCLRVGRVDFGPDIVLRAVRVMVIAL